MRAKSRVNIVAFYDKPKIAYLEPRTQFSRIFCCEIELQFASCRTPYEFSPESCRKKWFSTQFFLIILVQFSAWDDIKLNPKNIFVVPLFFQKCLTKRYIVGIKASYYQYNGVLVGWATSFFGDYYFSWLRSAKKKRNYHKKRSYHPTETSLYFKYFAMVSYWSFNEGTGASACYVQVYFHKD